MLMENRVEKLDGVEIPKKKRSLDLKSLYSSDKNSKNKNNKVLKRKYDVDSANNVDKNKRNGEKDSKRKEDCVNRLEHASKKSRRSLEEVHGGGGVSLGSNGLEKTPSGFSQELGVNGSDGSSLKTNGIGICLDDNGVRIPKGKRGFARRKKFDGDRVLVPPGLSKGKVDSDYKCVDQTDTVIIALGVQLNTGKCKNSATTVKSPKCKQENNFDDHKENKSSRSSSCRNVKVEDENSAAQNGNSISGKDGKKHNRRKNMTLHRQSSADEAALPGDELVRGSGAVLAEDEDNLEQNAARMLSSRFDPLCTGFSSERMVAVSVSENGLSPSMSSGRDVVSHHRSSLGGSDSTSAAVRILRPRKDLEGKSLSRKRRHFYEMFSRDFDPYWVLNRRIKVFWPLDKSWYYGLVNQYDPERKLHHVKYDDRDEEWINLQNERFKLLLFPREVPSNTGRKRSMMRDRRAEDSYSSSYMDSEPIISWLPRSSRQVKSSSSGTLKKQKTSSELPNNVTPVSDKVNNSHGCLAMVTSRGNANNLSGKAALTVGLSDDRGNEAPLYKIKSCLKNIKGPIVYYRRRLRQRALENCHVSEGNYLCRSSIISSLPPVVEKSWTWTQFNISMRQTDRQWPLWYLDGSGLIKLIIPESSQLRVASSFLVFLAPSHLLGIDNFWLLRTSFLLQYGVVSSLWPKVQLEMLFVDNILGLSFFLFEGCLEQAVAFVFLVLTVFHQSYEEGKYYDLRTPVTIVNFKLSLAQDRRKQLVFAFYSYSKVKISKWLYLDFELKRHCVLAKHLTVSECTYDNIKALQSGPEQVLLTSAYGSFSSAKVVQKRTTQDSICMGLSKGSTCVGMSQSSGSKNHGPLPPFALPFSAAPTVFLGLHLKLLMGDSISHLNIPDHDSIPLPESAENSGRFIGDDCSPVKDCSNGSSEINCGNSALRTSLKDGIRPGSVACSEQEQGIVPFAASRKGDLSNFSTEDLSRDHNSENTRDGLQDPRNLENNATVQSHEQPCRLPDSDQRSSRAFSIGDNLLQSKCNSGSLSSLNGLSVEIPRFDQVDNNIGSGTLKAHCLTDLAWNRYDSVMGSPNRTTPRSMWHQSRHGINSSYKCSSPVLPNGNAELYCNGFGSGPKKPRTQVSYMLPYGDVDFSSKQRNVHNKGMSHKRIRRANERRIVDSPDSSHKHPELLSCDANVLITHGDRGWRECGAQIVLELVDHNEWRLAVKHSGSTKYFYKAHQFLQPGSTNRYTHAMMWKGGKDWILEFSDRSQWTIFKEMHEECYNRNIRAASVKNIPIPGVRLIEESDDNCLELAFFRSSPKYISQVESDVEMALNPSHILYDMDSDDEQWLFENHEVCGDFFEKAIDMLEKVAYSQKNDEFTTQEIEELFSGVRSMDVVRKIYDYWWQKRQRKGIPLIRQLQPPPWERYQQQLKDWESAIVRKNIGLANGSREKFASAEKPPMFAFCLKPRGLEVPHKGSKQRSHRRCSAAGQNNIISGEHDGYHAFGRRSNGFVLGDDYVVSPGNSHESSEFSPSLPTPRRVFSPRDISSMGYFPMNSNLLERNICPKLHRNKSKKMGTFSSPHDPHNALYNHRTIPKRNGVQQWNMSLPDWSAQKNYQADVPQRLLIEHLDGSDLDEFRLRDASGAAKHARNMAKLKKEKAQRSLYRADLAIHKAVVALMNAEAIKSSAEDSMTTETAE